MILEEYNRQTKKLNVLGQYNKQEFSNRAFCILAHCDTENKLKQLNDKIDIVKQKYNLEIYLFSHLFVPEHIVNKVDYFLFNKKIRDIINIYTKGAKILSISNTINNYLKIKIIIGF